MKIYRSLWMSAALSASAVVAGALLWTGGTSPASAVVSTLASAGTAAVSGTVIGSPESVSFSGSLAVNSKRVSDPDFGNPDIVVVSVDLSGMKGTGLSSGRSYAVTGQEVIQRRLVSADTLLVTFPFSPSGSSMSMSPRIGAAKLALTFDVTTGALTNAAAVVSNP
jgi:hypothetical protein